MINQEIDRMLSGGLSQIINFLSVRNIAAPAARPAPSSEFRRMTMTMTKKKPQTEGDSDK
jgi:hypothetical protein